jgi:hypothetical protein
MMYQPRPMPPRMKAAEIRKEMMALLKIMAVAYPRECLRLAVLIEATKRRRDPSRPGTRTVTPDITPDIVDRVLAMKGNCPWLTGQEIGMACGINLGRVNDILTGVITQANCLTRRKKS